MARIVTPKQIAVFETKARERQEEKKNPRLPLIRIKRKKGKVSVYPVFDAAQRGSKTVVPLFTEKGPESGPKKESSTRGAFKG